MSFNTNIAKHAGFCSGVKHAYKSAVEIAQNGGNVYMLGHLVHNSAVIKDLEDKGIKSVRSLSEIPEGTRGFLLISAHGVGPAVYAEAQKTGLKIIDTTCAWVKKVQKIAKELSAAGYQVLIVGDKDHTEVRGIMGWAGEGAVVIEDSGNIDLSLLSNRAGIVAQTTQSIENLNGVVEIVKGRVADLKVHNTICDATSKMQGSAIEVAKNSDLMLVIGDKKSANTKRLKELCMEQGVETYQIQKAEELNTEWLKGRKNIGITAGASTPDWVIDEVVNKISP